MHYNMLKYILVIGRRRARDNQKQACDDTFSNINLNSKIILFPLITSWLTNLVNYKNSALYISSYSIDKLI